MALAISDPLEVISLQQEQPMMEFGEGLDMSILRLLEVLHQLVMDIALFTHAQQIQALPLQVPDPTSLPNLSSPPHLLRGSLYNSPTLF